jgi:hypothetical protein
MTIDPWALPEQHIAVRILFIGRHMGLLNADLALFYGIQVRPVKRNLERIPKDFLLQFSDEEVSALGSRSMTSKQRRGGRYHVPHSVVEQRVAMLATSRSRSRS